MWGFYVGQPDKAPETGDMPAITDGKNGLKYLQYYAAHNVYHPGIDLNYGNGSDDCNNDVKPVAHGFVEYVHTDVSTSRGFGKFIILSHDDGTFTRYAHLSDIEVTPGQDVSPDTIIGHVGKTGTGSCHLHYEVFTMAMAKRQVIHKYPWRYYPTGETKEYVAEHYIDPMQWVGADILLKLLPIPEETPPDPLPVMGTEDTTPLFMKESHTVFFTSYNPEVGQTDASPCIGASGKNQCELAREGVRMLALSRDLVGHVGRVFYEPFTYGDKIWLEGETDDPRCNGEFEVVDTMNKRYTMRGDLFFMDRSDNTSCTATINKI